MTRTTKTFKILKQLLSAINVLLRLSFEFLNISFLSELGRSTVAIFSKVVSCQIGWAPQLARPKSRRHRSQARKGQAWSGLVTRRWLLTAPTRRTRSWKKLRQSLHYTWLQEGFVGSMKRWILCWALGNRKGHMLGCITGGNLSYNSLWHLHSDGFFSGSGWCTRSS